MRTWQWFTVAALLSACGDKSPPEKCDDLISDLCTRGVQCIPGGGTYDQCIQEVQQSIPCGKARSVASSYDRCVSEINADSCAVLFPTDPQTGQPALQLPADCMSVILQRTAPAPLTGWNAQLGLCVGTEIP